MGEPAGRRRDTPAPPFEKNRGIHKPEGQTHCARRDYKDFWEPLPAQKPVPDRVLAICLWNPNSKIRAKASARQGFSHFIYGYKTRERGGGVKRFLERRSCCCDGRLEELGSIAAAGVWAAVVAQREARCWLCACGGLEGVGGWRGRGGGQVASIDEAPRSVAGEWIWAIVYGR